MKVKIQTFHSFKKAKRIHSCPVHPSRKTKGSPSGWKEMKPDRNSNPEERIKGPQNGKIFG